MTSPKSPVILESRRNKDPTRQRLHYEPESPFPAMHKPVPYRPAPHKPEPGPGLVARRRALQGVAETDESSGVSVYFLSI